MTSKNNAMKNNLKKRQPQFFLKMQDDLKKNDVTKNNYKQNNNIFVNGRQPKLFI